MKIRLDPNCNLLKSDRLLEIFPFAWSQQDLENGESIFKLPFQSFLEFIEDTDIYRTNEQGMLEKILSDGLSLVFSSFLKAI